ncbi:Ig-like domain-containing protein [Blastococcus sp. CT_GayMR16]|uniref:L,D-transpeptidase n=1 Tax=Blastococcus sp. CT_GayMR16 TaxID=2559607 RepID=UPI001FD7DD38|nr:Ig-like domain-containing protein [Blastococcus sp. CT_GayMR16]
MRRTAAIIATGALVFLAGCSGDDSGGSRGAAEEAAAPAQVSLAVADGSTDVSPVVPLEIAVTDGELGAVKVVDGAGAEVTGTVAEVAEQEGTAVWTPEGQLAYGTSYTLTASASNADDEEATASSTFTTVSPAAVSTPSIGPLDGMTVGVGMPIRVYFDDPVVDKAAVESHLLVTSSTPTDGVWNWWSDSEIHFRPSQYWPANTQVTLDANLYGVNFGEGIWGEKNRAVSFSIGAKHVSIADAGTHVMEVYDGDQLVQTYPISAGSPDNPSYNGPHVVTEMNRERIMDSSTYGVPVDSPGGYRTPVEYAVRISDSGEFVHAAPWSVAQQGNTNVSHGCINMSTERAAWFFNFSQPGDIVEIRNSTAGDLRSDIYDWTIPWDQWQAGSALK